jgi:sRNA-binding protein
MGNAMKREDIDATIELLCERFPRAFILFQQKRQPLKIGIRDDLVAALGDAIDHQLLGAARTPTTSSIRRYKRKASPASISMASKPVR